MKTSKKKNEVQLLEEFFKKEGFEEITEKESKSAEFRDSLREFDMQNEIKIKVK